jgi:flagellin
VVTNQVAAINSAPTSAASGLFDAGTLVLNGVAVGASKATDDSSSDTTANGSLKANSAIAISAAINRVSSLTGVSASAAANVIVGNQFTAGAVSGLVINGITITNSLGSNSSKIDVINAINNFSGQTGVVASDNGVGITYTAADGRNIALSTTAGSENAALGMSSGTLGTGSSNANVYYSKIQLSSANKFTVSSGVDGNTGFSILGFQAGTYGGANNGLKINQIDVSTQSGAQTAITAIDAAISTVSAIQSNVGAYENRLASTVTNLQSMNTNMSASRSTIQDTDYSTTTTALARNQIISQAATAMLAQANQSGQTVLSLLK